MTGLPRHLLRKNSGKLNLFCLAWFDQAAAMPI
jgi:hypothetical protein